MPTIAHAQASIVGTWRAMVADTSSAELTLAADGHFTFTTGGEDQRTSERGIWQRHGDEVQLSPDPADQRPIFTLVSAGPWTAAAQAAVLRQLRDADKDRIARICPWTNEPDVMATIPAIGAQRATATEARKALAEAKLASDRASTSAQQAIDDQTRSAYAAGIAAMRGYRQAWGQARDAYASAGLDLPSQPEPREPAACRVGNVAIADDLVGVRFLPDDARMAKLGRRMSVGFELPAGTTMAGVGLNNWAFKASDAVEGFQALTIYYPAGRGSETLRVPAADARARVLTVRADLDALMTPAYSETLSVKNDALILDSDIRFTRDEPGLRYRLTGVDGVTSTLRLGDDLRFFLALDRGGASIATHGAWARTGKRIVLTPNAASAASLATLAHATAANDEVTDAVARRGGDDRPCQPGEIAMVTPPGVAPLPDCSATTSLADRYVAVTLATPDRAIRPDGVSVALTAGSGESERQPSENGVALFPFPADGSVSRLGLSLPDGRSLTLDIPEQWRDARLFAVLLNADAFSAALPFPALRVDGKALVPDGMSGGRFVPAD